MKQNWSALELAEHFTLQPGDLKLVSSKVDLHRLGQAALLKYFQLEGRFPFRKTDLPKVVLNYLASQLKLDPDLYIFYNWKGRSIKEHRAQIREYLQVREATVADVVEITRWLKSQSLRFDQDEEQLKTRIYARFRELKLELVTPGRLERLLRSIMHTYEESFFARVYAQLSQNTTRKLDQLLLSVAQKTESVEAVNDPTKKPRLFGLNLKLNRASLDSIWY